jgi:hypothetical protein
MKWIDARTTKPLHNQEVVIFYNDVHDLAIYDREKNIFRLRSEKTLSADNSKKILWAQLVAP